MTSYFQRQRIVPNQSRFIIEKQTAGHCIFQKQTTAAMKEVKVLQALPGQWQNNGIIIYITEDKRTFWSEPDISKSKFLKDYYD